MRELWGDKKRRYVPIQERNQTSPKWKKQKMALGRWLYTISSYCLGLELFACRKVNLGLLVLSFFFFLITFIFSFSLFFSEGSTLICVVSQFFYLQRVPDSYLKSTCSKAFWAISGLDNFVWYFISFQKLMIRTLLSTCL